MTTQASEIGNVTLQRVTAQPEAAARKGLEAVRETAQLMRERALESAGEAAVLSDQSAPANFQTFAEFLREPGSPLPLLSPRRFSEVMSIDLQTLADQAHVHRNTVARAPGAKALQDFIREALRVIKAATDLNGELPRALWWYRNEPLAAFKYQTAERLVSQGRADDVLSYVESLEAGAAG